MTSSPLSRLAHICSCGLHTDLMLFQVHKELAEDIRPLAVSLSRMLSSQFKELAEGAVERALDKITLYGSSIDERNIKTIIDELNDELGEKLSERTAEEVARAVEMMYALAKTGTARKLHIPASFQHIDRDAQMWLRRSYPWWVGHFHSTVLAEQVSAIARQGVIERGIAGRELAAMMRKQLERIYSLGPGAPSPLKIPDIYHGTADQYWSGLANNAAAMAQIFGRLSAYHDAELHTYVISAVMDERTCDLCRFMNGKEFSVRDGEALRDRILESDTPEEYKNVAGWIYLKQAKEIFSAKGIAGLAATSLALPTYHFLCRCTIEAKI